MAKLYPPVLENTVPACYKEKGMVKITIPFSMNRSVSTAQVGGFELKIKTVQSGSYLYSVKTSNASQYTITDSNCSVTFYFEDSDNKLKLGQFYRVQLAYLSVDQTLKNEFYNEYILGEITEEEYNQKLETAYISGYYSDSALIKYTSLPKVYINNFREAGINNYAHNYIGYYDQSEGDATEKVSSYCFNLYNEDKVLFLSSEEQAHNSSTDTNANISIDKYSVLLDLKYNSMYYIQYEIQTINGLNVKSPLYKMIQRETIDPELYGDLTAEANFEDGYIEISIEPITDYFFKKAYQLYQRSADKTWINNIETIEAQGFSRTQAETIFSNRNKINDFQLHKKIKNTKKSSGSFILTRADENSSYSQWEPLCQFKLYEQIPNGVIFRDFTVQQGVKYQYSIQQYNDYGLYSKRIYSNKITADFEDIFLVDGERQLKIRYNAKVKKFASTVLEQKQDTIGSKYPYIFRNGQVNYHEFSISGLISYLMDNNHFFMNDIDSIDLYRTKTKNNLQELESVKLENKVTDYHADNMKKERLFKTEVLNWLNNGKPKLFRSSEEGNFIVRLMKVSLSPMDKLGRLLHTFNCSAYEIAECTNENLQKLNILNIIDEDKYILQAKTQSLEGLSPGSLISLNLPSNAELISISFEDLVPGDIVNFIHKNESKSSMAIGPTGMLYLDNLSLDIIGITLEPRFKSIFNVSYDYYYLNDNWKSFYTYVDGKYVKEDGTKNYNSFETYYKISNNPLKGSITYNYLIKRTNTFEHIKNVSYNNSTMRQFIGEHDILKEIQYVTDELKDYKKELLEFCYLKATKRPVDQIVTTDINMETLEDSNEFFYGANDPNNGNRSERFPLIELIYPIGLRAYKPGEFFIKKEDGSFDRDSSEEFDLNKKYYLKGDYRKTPCPVGLVLFEEGKFFIKHPFNSEEFIPANEWSKDQQYYSRTISLKGLIRYHKVEYTTPLKEYLYEPGKFYRKTSKPQSEIIPDGYVYTLSNKFIPELYYSEEYYEIDESQENYVDAYVTANENYVYKPYNFYMHITDPYGRDDYALAESVDFNINEIELIENASIEYDVNNLDVIKYYKMKSILPHVLHQVGLNVDANGLEGWSNINTGENSKTGYATQGTTPGKIYKFYPKKYRDFYNNKNYRMDEYDPSIVINGHIISVNDTIIFKLQDLRDFKQITELKSGNGVIVDIIYNTKEYDYIVEDTSEISKTYEFSKANFNSIMDRLSLDPKDENYIDLSNPLDDNYNDYYNNIFQADIKQNYEYLITAISRQVQQ